MAIAVAHDVSQYYNSRLSRGSSTFTCSLDADGAFDHIPHSVIFGKLDGMMPDYMWRLLYRWYDSMYVTVRHGTSRAKGNGTKVKPTLKKTPCPEPESEAELESSVMIITDKGNMKFDPPCRSATHTLPALFDPPCRSATHTLPAMFDPPCRSATHTLLAMFDPPCRSATHTLPAMFASSNAYDAKSTYCQRLSECCLKTGEHRADVARYRCIGERHKSFETSV